MADFKISDLPDGVAAEAADMLEVSRPGAPNLSRRVTAQSIADLAAAGVSGPVSSTDNTLARFNGTAGDAIQGSGVTLSDSDEIAGYRAHRNEQTGTTYTLQASDAGKVVELTNASAITLTAPNSLPEGFSCTLIQGGAGQVTISAASGATLRNRQSHAKIAGQWGAAFLHVRDNAGGAAAEYVLGGDTAA